MDRETATPAVHTLSGPVATREIDRHHTVSAPSEHSHSFVWDATAEATGPFCTDVDGNVFLDFTSHIGAAPLGYNHPRLRAKLAEFDLPDPMKIAGHDFYYAGSARELPTSTDLMERLVASTEHYGLDTVFLSNSGAEAVENALKITHAARPAASSGIAFARGFHGRTLGALSVTRADPVYTRGFPGIAGVQTLPFCDDRDCSRETCSCGFFTPGTSRFEELLSPAGYLDPDEVAFVVVEPVQGVGGYRMPSPAFMEHIEAVTEDHDIPVIADEIQTGVGRTGEMWAIDHYPLDPDVIASAKALRVGATIGRGDLFPDRPNRLGSTWGAGDLLGSLLGVLTLDVIEEEGLMANAVDRGRQFTDRLAEVDLPGVDDVRGLGLLLAVEYGSRSRRDAVVDALFERGLLVTGCGEKTVRFLPPLSVSAREIDLGADLLIEVTRETAQNG